MASLSKHNVQNEGQALAFLVDCTLSTATHLASLRRPRKFELRRQVAIAQQGIDWMHRFGIDFSGTQAQEVMEAGGSVAEWIKHPGVPLVDKPDLGRAPDSIGDALARMANCVLATVADLSLLNSPPVGELKRQKEIATLAVDWMDRFEVDYSDTRAKAVKLYGSVETWAKQFTP